MDERAQNQGHTKAFTGTDTRVPAAKALAHHPTVDPSSNRGQGRKLLSVPVHRGDSPPTLTPSPLLARGRLRGLASLGGDRLALGLTSYRVVRRQLEEVRGEDGGGKEPQEDEAAHSCVPHVQVIWGRGHRFSGVPQHSHPGMRSSCPSWGLASTPSPVCLSVPMGTTWSHRCAPTHQPSWGLTGGWLSPGLGGEFCSLLLTSYLFLGTASFTLRVGMVYSGAGRTHPPGSDSLGHKTREQGLPGTEKQLRFEL